MANKKRKRKAPAHRSSTGPEPARTRGRAASEPDTAERRARKEAARRRREEERKRLRRRQRWSRLITVTAVVVVGLVAIRFLGRTNSPNTPAVFVSPSASPADPATLPGMQDHPPPWTNGANAQLGARIAAIGLPPEGGALHTHEHLDVLVNGHAVTVPEGIGLGSAASSPLHTHDASGIIHVEASTQGPFTLGQFFDVWGVKLTPDCLDSMCEGGVRVYVDGHQAAGDPRQIRLVNHQEIAVVYGTPPATIPSSYRFPALL
jgi:hypothetical protein